MQLDYLIVVGKNIEKVINRVHIVRIFLVITKSLNVEGLSCARLT